MIIRVLLAKPGIDGHDIGVKVVARSLRDAGMEVIYTGLRTTVSETVRMAVQEDVDVIGISNLSGQHVRIMSELRRRLGEAGAQDILLLAGGSLLREDLASLREAGVDGCFPPGTHTDDIIGFIRDWVSAREAATVNRR